MVLNQNCISQIIYSAYRYTFNGMEADHEISGHGNSFTTQFRQYDPRLGRWKSLDPVTYVNVVPYSAMGNNPVVYTDENGADIILGIEIRSKPALAKIAMDEIEERMSYPALKVSYDPATGLVSFDNEVKAQKWIANNISSDNPYKKYAANFASHMTENGLEGKKIAGTNEDLGTDRYTRDYVITTNTDPYATLSKISYQEVGDFHPERDQVNIIIAEEPYDAAIRQEEDFDIDIVEVSVEKLTIVINNSYNEVFGVKPIKYSEVKNKNRPGKKLNFPNSNSKNHKRRGNRKKGQGIEYGEKKKKKNGKGSSTGGIKWKLKIGKGKGKFNGGKRGNIKR